MLGDEIATGRGFPPLPEPRSTGRCEGLGDVPRPQTADPVGRHEELRPALSRPRAAVGRAGIRPSSLGSAGDQVTGTPLVAVVSLREPALRPARKPWGTPGWAPTLRDHPP